MKKITCSSSAQLKADKEGTGWLIQNLTGKTNTPAILQRIGDINFNGDISGYLSQLTTHGTLLTDVGSIQANVTMHSDMITHLRSYSGKIISPELNLGALLDQEKTLGNTTFDIELKGFKYHDGKAES